LTVPVIVPRVPWAMINVEKASKQRTMLITWKAQSLFIKRQLLLDSKDQKHLRD